MQAHILTAMTIFVILLAVLILADVLALTKGLRHDPTRRPPRSWEDWGTPSLPTTPFAAR